MRPPCHTGRNARKTAEIGLRPRPNRPRQLAAGARSTSPPPPSTARSIWSPGVRVRASSAGTGRAACRRKSRGRHGPAVRAVMSTRRRPQRFRRPGATPSPRVARSSNRGADSARRRLRAAGLALHRGGAATRNSSGRRTPDRPPHAHRRAAGGRSRQRARLRRGRVPPRYRSRVWTCQRRPLRRLRRERSAAAPR